jgi:heme-degrading monooxygenase HmoA
VIAVIFAVELAEREEYFRLAGELAPILYKMDGFISIERYQSLNDPSRVLSLSFWRDEAAVAAWRNKMEHRAAQSAGRGGVFRDYTLRVAEVVRDYGMRARAEAPKDSRVTHES